jgi:hypothetical protein
MVRQPNVIVFQLFQQADGLTANSLETVRMRNNKTFISENPQSSSTQCNYSKCGVYTVENDAGC